MEDFKVDNRKNLVQFALLMGGLAFVVGVVVFGTVSIPDRVIESMGVEERQE